MEFGMIVFFGIMMVIFSLCFLKIKDGQSVLDKKATQAIKGILCIFIMLHNVGLDCTANNEAARLICDHSGAACVGIFFFLSGYGILQSYKKNGVKSLKRLLFRNTLKLYLVAVSINIIEYFAFFKGAFEIKDLLLRIFNLDIFNNFNRMNRHGWFIASILAMYLIFIVVFYISSKFKNKNSTLIATIIVVFISVLFRVLAKIFDNGGMYTNGIPLFGLGLLYSYFYNFVNKLCLNKKIAIPVASISLIAFVTTFIFLWGTFSSYALAILIVIGANYFRVDNKLTLFLGNISLGVYLFTDTSMHLTNKFIDNPYIYAPLNILITIGLGTVLFFILFIIEKLISKFALKRQTQVNNN